MFYVQSWFPRFSRMNDYEYAQQQLSHLDTIVFPTATLTTRIFTYSGQPICVSGKAPRPFLTDDVLYVCDEKSTLGPSPIENSKCQAESQHTCRLDRESDKSEITKIRHADG